MEQLQEITENSVELIIENLLGEKPASVRQLTNGLSNFVYEVEMTNGDDLIVRISDLPQRLNSYLKEQWCAAKAKEKGIPVPEILEVGNELIGHPYMVVRKIIGIDGNIHQDKRGLLIQLAKLNAIINSIDTGTYGYVFDWSSNTLTKNATWQEFLEKEIKIVNRLEMFRENKVFTPERQLLLEDSAKELYKLQTKPVLNHGDMRLKNLLVNEEGQILSLLDWENAISAIPYWDLSIALHDLSSDEKDAYIYEYGFSVEEFKEISKHIKTINLLNYAWAVETCINDNRPHDLEIIKAKLNGHLDLYSLDGMPVINPKNGIFSKISNFFK